MRMLPALLLASLALSPASRAADVATTLTQLRTAHGANALATHASVSATGYETIDGLRGDWQSSVELHGHRYATRSRNHIFPSAEGMDTHGRWRVDMSGQVHPLDSDEARHVGVTEAWLRRMAFLDAKDDAHYQALPDADENGHRYARVEATPKDGKPIALWIDPTTHLLHRASWPASFLTITRRFSDYRAVDGVQLPFRLATTGATVSGGEDTLYTDAVVNYRWDDANATAWQRPSGTVQDVSMVKGKRTATTPMTLEGGVLLVDASIDGHAPMPFILDTGGHAILTTDAALRLGLTTHGQGVSTGSGPGSMSTAYAMVQHLTLGDADIANQPFLVMPYGYAFYERGDDKPPIAGILGLEIFERFAVTFDHDAGVLRLEPFDHGDAPAAREGTRLPLQFTDDMPLVQATLDGKPGIFGIDTGNSGLLLLFPQWARKAGIIDRYAKGTPEPTGGVGGLFMAHVAKGQSLVLGNTPVSPVQFMLTQDNAGATGNPTEAANIGQDVLSRFNVHFDYRRGEMVLMPRTHPTERHYATLGILASKSENTPDRYRISYVMPGSPAANAGLKEGDTIVSVGGTPATKLGRGSLRDKLTKLPAGTAVSLTLGDGREMTLRASELSE